MPLERHLARSRALAAAGDDLPALDAAIEAIARRPHDVGALVHGVDCARRAGHPAAALPWLERLCALHPGHRPYRALLDHLRSVPGATDAQALPDDATR